MPVVLGLIITVAGASCFSMALASLTGRANAAERELHEAALRRIVRLHPNIGVIHEIQASRPRPPTTTVQGH